MPATKRITAWKGSSRAAASKIDRNSIGHKPGLAADDIVMSSTRRLSLAQFVVRNLEDDVADKPERRANQAGVESIGAGRICRESFNKSTVDHYQIEIHFYRAVAGIDRI